MKFSEVPLPSNRKFGFFFAVVFFVVALYCYWKRVDWLSLVFISLCVLFLATTLIRAELLAPLNRLWMKFGLLLGAIVNPIVIGSIFFLIFTPTALLMRLFGRDELRLKKRVGKTYWKTRVQSDLSLESFKQQF